MIAGWRVGDGGLVVGEGGFIRGEGALAIESILTSRERVYLVAGWIICRVTKGI